MGPPQRSCNSTLRPPKPKNITHIQFDTMYAASARESEIKFFVVDVPREVYFFKVRASNPDPNPDPDPDPNPNFYPNPSFSQVVVVPLTGDPDIYISFDTRTPTGANYTFMQDLP